MKEDRLSVSRITLTHEQDRIIVGAALRRDFDRSLCVYRGINPLLQLNRARTRLRE